MDDDLREQAREKWREVLHFEPPAITDPYTEFTTEQVFGLLWTRSNGLNRRDRRLVSLTAIALHGLNETLMGHLSAAVDSGDLEPEALHEWVLHLAYYGGWPLAANAYGVLLEVVSDRLGD